MKDYQAERLKHVLVAAGRSVGNRQRFLAAGLIGASGELVDDWQAAFERLSVLRKAEVRSRPGAFLANAADVVYRGRTSGTTAEALTYFAGEQWNQKRIEARSRSQGWWQLGDTPIVNVASRLGPVRLQDSSLVGAVDYAFLERLLQILREGPVVLRGYPSRLCEVAIALYRNQLIFPLNSVVAVVCTGERLFEVQRSLIGRMLTGQMSGASVADVPVVNEYGCQESGISGMSCPEEGRIHLDEDRCLYEIIDGECVTTDLWNVTMPMVRYVSGDVIEPYADPCPCGRSGLNAKILGRQSSLEMPSFPGVLNYQIRIENTRRQIRVQPETTASDETLAPLKSWFEQSFGAGDTEVLVESPFSAASATNLTGLNGMSSDAWLAQVTTKKWTEWIAQPLPTGAAQTVAALLQEMVVPQQVKGRGVSSETLILIHRLSQSAPSDNEQLEAMTIRVLLWSLSLKTECESCETTEPDYCEILDRFCRWRDRTTNLSAFSAIGFDLLAPLLTLDQKSVVDRWISLRQLIDECWPQGIKADRFTVHHYLTAVEIAGQNAQRRGQSWTSAPPSLLRPLSSVLLGDFYRTGAALSLAQVALWIETVHDCPNVLLEEPLEDTFEQEWMRFRRSLLSQHKANALQQLDTLFELAAGSVSQQMSKRRLSQCWLEKSYATLVFQLPFSSDEWLTILRENVGVLSPSGKAVSNPVAWSPILKAIAPKLIEENKPELAYACLFAAAPPNRKSSGFDRRSLSVNSKQAAISIL